MLYVVDDQRIDTTVVRYIWSSFAEPKHQFCAEAIKLFWYKR